MHPIQRFSEDADLSVSPTFLGFTEAELDEAPSTTARLKHYTDVAALWGHPTRTKALARMDVLQDVIRHKSRFFASSWANYGTAVPGTFHLMPAEHRYEELARDLEAMRPMFLAEAPTFTVLLKLLKEAEEGLNQAEGKGGRLAGIKNEN
jgi:hypothetical protein